MLSTLQQEQGNRCGLREVDMVKGKIMCGPVDHCILFLGRRETFGEFSAERRDLTFVV